VTYAEILTAVENMTAARRREVEDAYNTALWYAWGRIDAGEHRNVLNLDHGWRFAERYASAKFDMVTERTHSMDSVLNMWAEFVTEVLPTPTPESE